MAPAEVFKAGDIVRHRMIDGPDMQIMERVVIVGRASGTVHGATEDVFEARWFIGESLCVGWFPEKFLERVSDQGG